MAKLASTSLSAVRDQVTRIATWLDGLGISHAKGRFAKYFQTLTNEDNPDAVMDSAALNALFELQELGQIATLPAGLFESERARSSIRKLAKGEEFFHDEKDGKGRSFSFELATAAVIHRNLFTVRLEDPADVVIEHSSVAGWIECKRPMAISSVPLCLKEAMSWFADRPIVDGARISIVALDLSRALNSTYVIGVASTVAEREERAEAAMRLGETYAATQLIPMARSFRGAGSVDALAIRMRLVVSTDSPARIDAYDNWRLFELNSSDLGRRVITAAFAAPDLSGQTPIPLF